MSEKASVAEAAEAERPAVEIGAEYHYCANKECGVRISESRIEGLGYVPKYCVDCQRAQEIKNGRVPNAPVFITPKRPAKLRKRQVDQLRR